jgi:hypothetical protein
MPNELGRLAAEKSIGGKTRLQDFEGVGSQTIRNLRAKGFRGLEDIQGATQDELARVEGVGQQRAASIKQQAPRDTAQTGPTGSVSAAGIKTPHGEFKTEVSDFDTAEARFESSMDRGIGRSQEAAAADKGKRAPITTDVEEWKNNKGTLDFPGVDTPSSEPEFERQDARFVERDDLTAEGQEQWDSFF